MLERHAEALGPITAARVAKHVSIIVGGAVLALGGGVDRYVSRGGRIRLVADLQGVVKARRLGLDGGAAEQKALAAAAARRRLRPPARTSE